MPTGGSIELPFPSSKLAGHNSGHWRSRSAVVKQHREWARLAALGTVVVIPAGDVIPLTVTFHPPNKRGDELNYLIRCKPYFDGIADALCLNDKRFRPTFVFGEVEKPGRVIVTVEVGA